MYNERTALIQILVNTQVCYIQQTAAQELEHVNVTREHKVGNYFGCIAVAIAVVAGLTAYCTDEDLTLRTFLRDRWNRFVQT
jgi:hypothetical protein